jgi:hypothetical protein
LPTLGLTIHLKKIINLVPEVWVTNPPISPLVAFKKKAARLLAKHAVEGEKLWVRKLRELLVEMVDAVTELEKEYWKEKAPEEREKEQKREEAREAWEKAKDEEDEENLRA